MKVIHKYPMPVLMDQVSFLQMPEDAHVLHAGFQDNRLCFWALIDPEQPMRHHTVRVIGTGQPIDDDVALIADYVGTVQDGPFVWHVFVGY
jgi:hypothetical protein